MPGDPQRSASRYAQSVAGKREGMYRDTSGREYVTVPQGRESTVPSGYKRVRGAGKSYGTRVYVKDKPKPKPKPKPAPAPRPSSGGGGSGGGGGGGGGGRSGSVKKYTNKAEKKKPLTRQIGQRVTDDGVVDDEPKETVAWQIDNLLRNDSPYLQRARYAGERMAQSRGLQNTSMAAQASEAAAIDAVLPIAAQDANTYFSQDINNQNTVNRFRENLQQLYGNLALGEQRLDSELLLAARNFEYQRTLLGDELAARLQMARIGGISSIFSTPGLTPAQQEFGVSRLNSFYASAPESIRNFQMI